jgi:hypothetical protein
VARHLRRQVHDRAAHVTGTAEDDADGTRLAWSEEDYVVRGRRSLDFDGIYEAVIQDGIMNGAWFQDNRRVANFTMTPVKGTVGASVPAEPRTASR